MRFLFVAYDNDSYITWFPQGLAYIASVLRKAGHHIDVYSQDMHHYPDEHLTKFLDDNKYDGVAVSVIAGYYQYRKLLKISDAINKSKKRPVYLIGGHGPSPEPEYFLKKTRADVAVIGEGEVTAVELMDALANKKSLASIEGIAYREGDVVHVNPRRALIKDIDAIPLPAYDLFPIDYYRLYRMPNCAKSDFIMPVLSGRGCTFECNFCYRLDEGLRERSNEAILEEVGILQKDYAINYVIFSDELLVSSVRRVTGLCEAIIKSGIKFKWCCNGRLNYAKKDALNLMKEAGCVFINYGIEAMDDQVLKNMNKALTTKQIVDGIENTLASGISPGFNIIYGHIGDNRETLQKGVDFLLKYDDGAQLRTIRPVTPYPGSPLYYHAIKKGLLKDCEDFYETKHTNSDLLAVNFTELSDDEFYDALYKANVALLNNYMEKKHQGAIAQCKRLYFDKDVTFRGFRQA